MFVIIFICILFLAVFFVCFALGPFELWLMAIYNWKFAFRHRNIIFIRINCCSFFSKKKLLKNRVVYRTRIAFCIGVLSHFVTLAVERWWERKHAHEFGNACDFFVEHRENHSNWTGICISKRSKRIEYRRVWNLIMFYWPKEQIFMRFHAKSSKPLIKPSKSYEFHSIKGDQTPPIYMAVGTQSEQKRVLQILMTSSENLEWKRYVYIHQIECVSCIN